MSNDVTRAVSFPVEGGLEPRPVDAPRALIVALGERAGCPPPEEDPAPLGGGLFAGDQMGGRRARGARAAGLGQPLRIEDQL